MIDVGCAYLLRRNVDFTTAVDGVVKRGNVGHFACVYATIANLSKINLYKEPTSANCQEVFLAEVTKNGQTVNQKIYDVEMSKNNTYPLLCKCK